MFIKELDMYVDYFSNKVSEVKDSYTFKQQKYLKTFQKNMIEGIEYYQQLFSTYELNKEFLLKDLNRLKDDFLTIQIPVFVKA